MYNPTPLAHENEKQCPARKGCAMFALAALICFVLWLFKASVSFSLEAAGLAFVALHLLVGFWPFGGVYPWTRRQ